MKPRTFVCLALTLFAALIAAPIIQRPARRGSRRDGTCEAADDHVARMWDIAGHVTITLILGPEAHNDNSAYMRTYRAVTGCNGVRDLENGAY